METATTNEDEKVVMWRVECLTRMGRLTPLDVARIAIRLDIELGYVQNLVNAGCPSELVAEIVL